MSVCLCQSLKPGAGGTVLEETGLPGCCAPAMAVFSWPAAVNAGMLQSVDLCLTSNDAL